VQKLKVKDLSPRKRSDVTVKVVNIGQPRSVVGLDGSTRQVTDVLVGDETGSILMSLWGDQASKVSVGKVITITNGYVSVVRGSMRLTLGREGQMKESTEQIAQVDTKNNLSDLKVEERRRRF
jgi:replication factor A1